MVLEALAAVGLAGNIVQFIDFCTNLLAEAREIHNSTTGSSNANVKLGTVAERLRHLAVSLSASTPSPGPIVVQQLRSIADEATVITDELLKAIEEVKLKGSKGGFKTFAHALQHIGKNKQIRKLSGKLARMQGQLNTHLLVLMSDKNSDVLKELQALADENRRLGINTTQNLDDIRTDILNAVHALKFSSTLHTTTVQGLQHSIERSELVNRLDLERMSKSMSQLSQRLCDLDTASSATRENHALLGSLCFRMMKVREAKVVAAHTNTFEWIFEETGTSKPTGFVDWLANQEGIYWIMGKAGSGKSTLIKFLANHNQTRKELLRWSGANNRLITANFFFWSAGSEMQKSQEGLLQSLLFEVLRQCPSLIPDVLARRTVTTLVEEEPRWTVFSRSEDKTNPWSLSELLECFSVLRNQIEHSTRFCFFIDGMDEYEGECSDLIKALQDLSSSPSIKICASSRPWFVFKDAFGKCPMLRLEDLTREDIASYVNDTLRSHPHFAVLHARDIRYLNLIEQIVNKAHGVFLWVFLVTVSLRRGFTNADSISDLQTRISLLPDSLEGYFRHILGTVEDIYRNQTAKTFQYALHASLKEPLPLIVLSFLDEEDPNFALHSGVCRLSAEEVEVRYDDTRRRLDGRTRGLLEANHTTGSEEFGPTINFLHRTVRDFFLTKEMQSMLSTDLEPGFFVDVDLCKAFLALMKSRICYTPEDCLHSVMYHLRGSGESTKQPLRAIVDEIERVTGDKSDPWMVPDFDALLVRYGIYYTVAERLIKIPQARLKPLLAAALDCSERSYLRVEYLDSRIVGLLLDMGADPNGIFRDRSAWVDFVARVHNSKRLYNSNLDDHLGVVMEILELLLLYGANPKALVPISEGSYSIQYRESGSFFTASELIRERFPHETVRLLGKSQLEDDTTADEWIVVSKVNERKKATNGGWLGWIQDKTTLHL